MGLTTFGLVLAIALIASPSPADSPAATAALEQPLWPPARHSRVWPEFTLRLHSSVQGGPVGEPTAAPVVPEHLNREDAAEAQAPGHLGLGVSGRARHRGAVPPQDVEVSEPAWDLKRPAASAKAEDEEAPPASLYLRDADSLQSRIQLIDLRLRELDEGNSIKRKVGEAVGGVLFWPIVGAGLGILFGAGSASGAQAFLEYLTIAGGLGAAVGAGAAIVMGVVSIVSEYRAVSRERAALLQEREDLQGQLKAHLQPVPSPGIGARVLAVRF